MNDTQRQVLNAAMAELPLVAILRGITPDEIVEVCDALIEAGFRLIEIPLNSPEPWQSIERAVTHCPSNVLIGAGTVLEESDTARLAELGAPLMITPNTQPELVSLGAQRGLAPMIGCMTPTEALAAAKAGATALKLFPAARMGTGYFKDIKAILPTGLPVLAVGGIELGNMAEWYAVGIGGFGFGSNLYKPGRSAAEVGVIASELVAEWQRLSGEGA
ncbi:2-dehydro-3-deoxy-6-phosphogalactonate aldolase [Halomonas huangheensis]|uniref:2-dehydro-3-deoxy-6-phosphogalactonate aldolase n=1 Tax=Halomonas huangheensis TaxID=1178482 RepID=W1N730_9GAMM|nr:2-dehydro-3-deoxy-6-phosphogalactonate aldolase [Halomonas huangheensis]ALM53120.1 2-dehydro-3-deoxy-6-phosphogalactonate aldolase [Halomonas huangheensis]ERL51309.1 2-dehydro-3-deoxy-6-phosphogalactonate aldolase [Halomonas huangheensis]